MWLILNVNWAQDAAVIVDRRKFGIALIILQTITIYGKTVIYTM